MIVDPLDMRHAGHVFFKLLMELLRRHRQIKRGTPGVIMFHVQRLHREVQDDGKLHPGRFLGQRL